jgi:hypothetical protein
LFLRTTGIRTDQLIPCQREPFPLVSVLSGGKMIADMYLGNTGEDFGPMVFLDDSPAAIVASMYGRGRVVYIAPNIDLFITREDFAWSGHF